MGNLPTLTLAKGRLHKVAAESNIERFVTNIFSTKI
jgi:hypothetical protein